MSPKLLATLAVLLLFSCAQGTSSSSATPASSVVPSSSTEPASSSVPPSSTGSATSSLPSSSSAVSSSSETSSSDPKAPYDYDGYYAALTSWVDGEDLKQQLHDIISGGTYQAITYEGTSTKTNWLSNIDADKDLQNRFLLDVVYSPNGVKKELTHTQWQREHAFCATLMCGTGTSTAVKTLGRATDFHNLFASSTNGNTSRGNKNYGPARPDQPEYTDRRTPEGDGYAYDETNFEPGDKDKGRLSRAIFYMATMYNTNETRKDGVVMPALQIVEDPISYAKGDVYKHGNLSALLEWATLPVDYLEVQHNESVYRYAPQIYADASRNVAQGNRNPYVDYPELVDYVFGSKKDQPGKLADLNATYDTLGMDRPGTMGYAVNDAKTEYENGEVFHKSDVSVVSLGYDLSETPYNGFSLSGISDGEALTEDGNKTITVVTDSGSVDYEITVTTNPISESDYSYELIGKKAGGEFTSIYDQSGVEHTVNFGGINWKVKWNANKVDSTSASLGVKFGGSATAQNKPVEELYFESESDFVYQEKNQVYGVFFTGSSASGTSYPVTITVGGQAFFSGDVGYVDTKTPSIVGTRVAVPRTGKVRIAFTNVTNALYIKNISVVVK